MSITNTRTSRSHLGWIAALTCSIASLVIAGPLDRTVNNTINRTNIGTASVSVYIADLDTGEEIADYHGSEEMTPASNMKILTSGAALFILGDDFTFRTEIIIDQTHTPPTLIIKADGDPALGDPAIFAGEHPGLTHDSLFDQIADAIKSSGITTFDRIIVDDSVFDRYYTHPCWPKDQLNRWYCAQVGGFNFHTNVISVFATPSASGGAPLVTLQPDAYWVDMQIKAKSQKNKRNTGWISRPTQANSFTLHGVVSHNSEIPVAVNSPSLFAGRVLATQLAERGITLGTANQATIDAVSLIEPSDSYTASKVVAAITTPISDVLERTNTDSYNLYAESLLKRIGYEISSDPGSWENGSTVIRMLLSEKLGAHAAENTIIADGSGMCRDNKVAPKTLALWMRKLARSDYWEAFEESLATPGHGTLRKRFKGNTLQSELHAKSGYLTGTYALSGVLTHPRSGQRIVFSIMINDVAPGTTSRNAKPLVDSLVSEIDQWMSQMAGSPAMGG